MHDFSHPVPALRLHHGAQALRFLPAELERLGCRRALVLCGASLGHDTRVLERVREALGSRCADIAPLVRAHSPLPAVQEAAERLRQLQADAVIALGGGSAVVTARAASILLAEAGPAHSLCTGRDSDGRLRSPRLDAPKLPQLVIPTTPTTAIVKAGSAMLDPADGGRMALFDPKTRAHAVFVDTALIATPPRELVVSSSLNTLAMTIEGLCSTRGDPMSDAFLMHALRLLSTHLPALSDDDSADTRAQLMMAAILCGHGTDYTGAGIAIPLGHAISARFHVDNGIANAIVMPHVLRFNAPAAGQGLGKMAAALGFRDTGGASPLDSLVDALHALSRRLGLPARLRDIGVTRGSLAAMAEVSMDDWFVRDNPRRVHDAAELETLLADAW